MTRHVRLREFLVGVEGLALFRTWSTATTPPPRRGSTKSGIVGSEEEATYGLGIDVPELDARAGYARWSETYDEPGNLVPDATVAAFRGLPGALVWDLTRR
ncbi:MAG: hypothetical protein H0V95_02080 [Actinobacteria bacterium]|nr:hypothetical protein [Actinomycetota bacterium]